MFQGVTMEHDVHCYKPLKHLQTAREEKACQRPFQIVPFTFGKLQETKAELFTQIQALILVLFLFT